MIYQSTSVGVFADLDQGEGSINFQWPDPTYGWEGLSIDLDGFCSRRRVIQSGNGPPEFIELQRDRVRLKFSPRLAKRLEFDEEIEILFQIEGGEFQELQAAIQYLREFKV